MKETTPEPARTAPTLNSIRTDPDTLLPEAGDDAVELPPAAPPRYTLGDVLGTGAMGMVMRATDKVTGRTVAIKFLTRINDPVVRERFLREGPVIARIQHPHVVRVFDVGEIDERPYLVIEYLSGGTLRQKCSSVGRIAPGVLLAMAAGCLDGLAAIHDQGIIHRDLKPDNLLFDERGRIKISDLGIAHVVDEQERLTRTGAILGTPRYLAPELIEGQVATAASDIYALGVTFYEMLAGVPPFDAASVSGVITAHLVSRPVLLTHHVPQLSTAVAQIIDRMMAKKPMDRPESARQLAEELAGAPRTRSGAHSAATLKVSVPPAAPGRRSPWPVAVGAAGLIGLALLLYPRAPVTGPVVTASSAVPLRPELIPVIASLSSVLRASSPGLLHNLRYTLRSRGSQQFYEDLSEARVPKFEPARTILESTSVPLSALEFEARLSWLEQFGLSEQQRERFRRLEWVYTINPARARADLEAAMVEQLRQRPAKKAEVARVVRIPDRNATSLSPEKLKKCAADAEGDARKGLELARVQNPKMEELLTSAVDLYQTVVNQQGPASPYLARLGAALLWRSRSAADWTDAITCLAASSQIQAGRDGSLLLVLGQAQGLSGDAVSAVQSIERALVLHPGLALIHRCLMLAYDGRSGPQARARFFAESVLALEDRSVNVFHWMGMYRRSNLGRAFLEPLAAYLEQLEHGVPPGTPEKALAEAINARIADGAGAH